MMKQLPLGVRLRDTARFASFVAGGNARSLRAASQGSRPGGAARRLAVGPAGTGKTHLLQAACAAVARARRSSRAYIDLALAPIQAGSRVATTWASSVSTGSRPSPRMPSGTTAIFRLHTLMQDGAGTARRRDAMPPPASIAFTLPDLRSRLLAAVGAPAARTRRSGAGGGAAPARSAGAGSSCRTEGALYLVHRLPRDMHSLCAVLDRLDEASLVAQRRLTVPFLRQALEDQGVGAA